MRRAFHLTEVDHDFLEKRGLPWETIDSRWLLINNFPIPAGYNCELATLALKIETSYPDTQIDMAYFFPALQLQNGKNIGALSAQQIDGKQFQRWSRHRTAQNPWMPGIDCLERHLYLVEAWLTKESEK